MELPYLITQRTWFFFHNTHKNNSTAMWKQVGHVLIDHCVNLQYLELATPSLNNIDPRGWHTKKIVCTNIYTSVLHMLLIYTCAMTRVCVGTDGTGIWAQKVCTVTIYTYMFTNLCMFIKIIHTNQKTRTIVSFTHKILHNNPVLDKKNLSINQLLDTNPTQ